jgi:para-aminobenzoate synthetase component 1
MPPVGFTAAKHVEDPVSAESRVLAYRLTPAPDPFECFEKLAGLPHTLFLDSSLRHPELGRYSYITGDPFDWLSVRAGNKQLDAAAASGQVADPFALLGERLGLLKQNRRPDLPPFQGGAAGLFGYDLCRYLERLPPPRRDDFCVPELAIGFYDWVIAFDHPRKAAWIVSTGFPERDEQDKVNRARRRLREIRHWLEQGTGFRPAPSGGSSPGIEGGWQVPGLGSVSSSFSRAAYLGAVDRIIEYIRAGDCFQVNLAQRLLSPAVFPPQDLYRRLRQRNAATFGGYFDLGEFVIASASPERFLQMIDGLVETRPIKGTRPRGANPEQEQLRKQELLSSAKDRAENIMIVDLLRNDLGRVCRYGSVQVPAVCRLETYRFLHHLVSEVRGRLREGLGPVDLLKATFPGGSVTGAPKIRAMEIISELEPVARGPYCGCLGYIGFDGAMDCNILIRTFTLGGGWVQFPVGGGIVADSTPDREYDETWLKAEGLLRALQDVGTL